ncbi:MAG: FkbM family methyltransferase [Candidatus Bathyarchaeota archaeon]|nr:FkbM family methyltransferase [Candidatus Bathyarchaeum sp.]
MLKRIFSRFKKPSPKRIDSPLSPFVDNDQILATRCMRLGTEYGGWNIPIDINLDKTSHCISAGAGEDISFDCELASKFNCTIHIIDPTPRAIDHFNNLYNAVISGKRFPINNSKSLFYNIDERHLKQIKLYPFGIAHEDAKMKFYLPKNEEHVSCSTVNLQKTERFFSATCYKLSSIKKKLGIENIALLKMDIEGAEYGVIRNIIEEDQLPNVLCIEFDEGHTPLDSGYADRISHSISLLKKAGMCCVYIEGCNATFIKNKNHTKNQR